LQPSVSPILEVTDLRVAYGDFEAVKGVSFELQTGGILGIVGESGSGKSTIAKTLIGLEKPSSGTISYAATPGLCPLSSVHCPSSSLSSSLRVQMIFQDAVGSLNPRMTVRQTLAEVLRKANRGEKVEKVGKIDRITPIKLLSQVGLSEAVLDQYPREMSGGQCQRVSIARALAVNPDILIADEPVSALDVSVQARILNLLRDLRRDLGLSIVLIAHDLAVVKNVCDWICVMERGRFVDVGPAEKVFADPQSEYTRRLLTAVPRI